MKKILSLLGVVIISLLFVASDKAFAFEDWTIQSFYSDIAIQEDGSMIVTETIKANFESEKRGIFREIPFLYYDEFRQSKSIGIDVLSVANENGEDWEFVDTYEYDYLNIRIGNPSVYLTGEQIYVITYRVTGAIGFFEDHDELYWDVTGNDWFVPILESSATVQVPGEQDIDLKARCFTGEFGSIEENCDIVQTGNKMTIGASDFLTIVVGWPKGIIAEPTQLEKAGGFLKNNYGYSFPFIAFLIMFGLWKKFGDDPEDPPGLVTQFDPPEDLTPAEVGYLIEGRLKKKFLSAELVNLAHKGFIHIKEKQSKKAWKEDDYTLIKKKDFEHKDLKEHEKMILKGIFLSKEERKVSAIPTSFYSKVSGIKNQIYKQLKEKKYFGKNPQSVKWSYLSAAIFIMMSSFSTVGFRHVHFFVGILLSGVVVFVFSFFMPKKTKRGVLALEHAKGFEQYISIAEDRRVKWEETQNLFFQYLSYAMVFGLAEKWAKAFKGVFKDMPEWYEGDPTGFNSVNFARSMNVFSSTTTSHIRPPANTGGGGYSRSSSSSYRSSSSGFSSGGFSGGGGGGGGGGSW